MNISTRLLTVQEVADILRLNILTVYEYLKRGDLIAIKLGRNYRIEETELRRFIQNHLTRAQT